jgi:hypothetical protein
MGLEKLHKKNRNNLSSPSLILGLLILGRGLRWTGMHEGKKNAYKVMDKDPESKSSLRSYR